ncbi:MAG: hypothetical protein JNK15_07635 [Planctomycetes bacterium]|nr:hypothetical protein [Planctomycetota bacterium]
MRNLAVSLLFAAPMLAQQFPEVEPNDTAATAQVVALGSQINGNISVAAELDWYTFTTTGGYHAIQMLSDTATGVDFVMEIFDASGTTLLAWTDDSGATGYTNYPSYFGVIPAGTYTLRCKAFSATATGTYQLNVGLAASKPYTATEVEPNGTLATATVVGDGAQIDASIGAITPIAYTDSVAPATVVSTGTVVSSTTTVITTSGFTAGAYNGVGYFVRFTSGVNAGLLRRLVSNTATALTTDAWGTAAGVGDTFEVVTTSPTIYTGAVTSSTTTIITCAPNLITSLFTSTSNSCAVRFTSGVNAGLSRTVTANSFNTITTSAWPTAPSPGDTFDVVAGGTTVSAALATPIAFGTINAGDTVRFTTGANVGLSRVVAAVLPGAITFTSGFTTVPMPGDVFEVDRVDADVYRIDVTAPKALVVFSVTDGTLPWVSGWSYEVMDAAGSRIASTFYGTALADSSAFQGRVSSFRVFPTGTFYVRIFQRRSLPTVSTPVLMNGNYRFELKVRDMATSSVAEAELAGVQTNNTVASAEPITPGQVGTGNITASTGADPADLWGPLTIPTGAGLIAFQITAAASGTPLTDASIELLQLTDPIAGTLSAPTAVTTGNTLEAANLNPRGVFNFSLPTTQYYLRVLSPGTGVGQSGDYQLEISVTDSPTYLAGNYVTATANATGCGTAGVPTIARVGSWEAPVVGQTFVQRVTNLNGVANFGLLVIGTSGALGPSGAPAGSPASIYNPQPLDLTLVGAPGCTLNVDPLLIDVMIGDVTGTADYVLPIPGNLGLIGATLFMQPCKWDFATPVNALGIQPGNWSRLIVGSRTF